MVCIKFPEWFIDALCDEDKEKARNNALKGSDIVTFKCPEGHITKCRLSSKISFKDMTLKASLCPICHRKEKYEKYRQTQANKRVYPQWFIDELVNEEDKKRALDNTLQGKDIVTFKCSRGHIYSKKVCFRIKQNGDPINGCLQCVHEDNKVKQIKDYGFPDWFIDELVEDSEKELARSGKLPLNKTVKIKCPTCGFIYDRLVKFEIDVITKKRIRVCPKCMLKTKNYNHKKHDLPYPQWFIDEIVDPIQKQKAIDGTLTAKNKVVFRCSKGHEFERTVANYITITTMKKRTECPYCKKEKRNNHLASKRSYPDWLINEMVHEEDKEKARSGFLKSTDRIEFYCKNCNKNYLCMIGARYRFRDGISKQSCPNCAYDRSTEKRNYTIAAARTYPQWFIDELVNEDNKEKARLGVLKSSLKVDFKCQNGHIYNQRIASHINMSTQEPKSGCPICNSVHRIEILAKMRRDIRVYPQWFIGELVDEDIKNRAITGDLPTTEITLFKCKQGHIYHQRISDHLVLSSGEPRKGCPFCFSNRSKSEIEIEDFIKSLQFNTEHKRIKYEKTLFFEVDILIPEKNIGIEYNGCFWHKTLPISVQSKDRLYHQNKYLACKKLGIRLISIFEPDWTYRKDKIKQYLKDLLLPIENKIHARKCEIKQIDYHTANFMYEEYHLLGKTTVQAISYGLYYNNELISCMSFQKGRYKENKQPVWTLTRFVTKSGYSIVGGASKLLKQFEKDFKPDLLLSYSDNDYFSGGLYSNLGFENKGCTNSPRYFWWLNNQELKRETCQLKYLSQQYPELYKESFNQTEYQNKEDYIMLNLGAFKVYRAGHTKWVKKYG